MAREKDSIQRLLDKGKTPDEIVKSGKYTQAEVDAYLDSDAIDTSDNAEPIEQKDIDRNTPTSSTGNAKIVEDSELDAALDVKPEDVEEVIETKTQNLFSGKTKSETEREYTKTHTATPLHEVGEVFDRPSVSQPHQDDDFIGSESGTGSAEGQVANPKLATASSDQKRIAAEKLYDLVVVPVYQKLCEFLPMTAKFGDRKIRSLVADDKINLEMPITWQDENGQMIQQTLRDLINVHNAECDETFKYDEKFIVDAREPSLREFVKRGWGIAEEDELMWILIMKAIEIGQGAIVMNLKKYDILAEAKVWHLENKKTISNPTQQTTPPPQPQPTTHFNPHVPPPPSQQPTNDRDIEEAQIVHDFSENEEKQ